VTSLADVLGVIAASLGVFQAASPLLQALHSHRRGSSEGVSLSFLCLLLAGGTAWLLYGIASDNLVIVIPNAVGVTAAGVTLGLTMRRRHAAG
jgi:uncharacterized protein with PQ loop repeat